MRVIVVLLEVTIRFCDRGPAEAIVFGRRCQKVCSLLAIGQSLSVEVYVDLAPDGNDGA